LKKSQKAITRARKARKTASAAEKKHQIFEEIFVFSLAEIQNGIISVSILYSFLI
jgi:hypothetical protein